MTVVYLGNYEADLKAAARAARRNTHLIVARHKQTGETQSWHARPRSEARAHRDQQRHTLGDAWTVRTVRVRRPLISALLQRG